MAPTQPLTDSDERTPASRGAKARGGRSNARWAWSLSLLVAGAVLVRLFVLEPFRIPSDSMVPTLLVGDHVLVNKRAYSGGSRGPRRGEVVVFSHPEDASQHLIKRVVGLPGDELWIVDDEVQLNGQPCRREPLADDYVYFNVSGMGGGWYAEVPTRLYRETLDGRAHHIVRSPHLTPPPRLGPFLVPPGHLFVLGDNRDTSSDSRFGLGVPGGPTYVPIENLRGRAEVVGVSFSSGGHLGALFGGTGVRLDRLMLPVR